MIVIDTHVWVWWARSSTKLSKKAAGLIHKTDRVGLSVISCWELGMLVSKGRLELDRDPLVWVERALTLPKLELIPLSPQIAVASTALPKPFHGDPADRIIVATTRALSSMLITKDDGIRGYAHVRTEW